MIIIESKSKDMWCSRRLRDTIKPKLKFNRESIQRVEELHYLGCIIIDDNNHSKGMKRWLTFPVPVSKLIFQFDKARIYLYDLSHDFLTP